MDPTIYRPNAHPPRCLSPGTVRNCEDKAGSRRLIAEESAFRPKTPHFGTGSQPRAVPAAASNPSTRTTDRETMGRMPSTTGEHMSSTMRAVEYQGAGGPEVLRIVERPRPEPQPGEVL